MVDSGCRSGADGVRLRLPNAEVVLRGSVPDEIVAALGDLRDSALFLGPDAVRVELELTMSNERWTVTQHSEDGVERLLANASAGHADLLDSIVGRLNRLAFDPDPCRLHLHGAAVEVAGVGVLIAGPSGSGKSTVTTELLGRGAVYLTDECVTVLPGSLTVYGYPKPITLKVGSVEYFRELAPLVDRPAAQNGRTHVRAGDLGPVLPVTRLGLVVVVRHDPDATSVVRPLSPAEACVQLLSDSLDGVRLGPSSLEVLAPLVGAAGCWELTYRDAADAAEMIGELRPLLRTEVCVPGSLLNQRSGDRTPGPCLDTTRSTDTSVRVVRFDTSAALHDGASRSLVVLEREQVAVLEDSHLTGESDVELGVLFHGELGERPWSPVENPLHFGLPGTAVGQVESRPAIAEPDIAQSIDGRCTGVIVAQLVRGRATASYPERVRSAHVAAQSTCALLERELPRVVDLMESAGVRPVLLKGPVDAHDGALPVHLRDYSGLDLLVPPSQMHDAVAALSTAGFRRCYRRVFTDPYGGHRKSVTLQATFSGVWGDRSAPEFQVDLHRTITPGPFGAVVPLEELHARAVPVRVRDRCYLSLHPSHRFLHHCLDVALGSPEPVLQNVRDLVLSAPRTPVGVDEVVGMARDWGVSAVVQRAIELGESRFPHALVPELVDSVRAIKPKYRERLYLGSYHDPHGRRAVPVLATLPALETWRDRIHVVQLLVRNLVSRRD